MKHIINTSFYEMCDVKRFNDFILSLKKSADQNLYRYNFKPINELIKIQQPYESLNKFVENSPTWLSLKDENIKWEEAQKKLKELKHTSEQVLDEIYPDYLDIYKHTITVEEIYSNSEEEESTKEEIFTFYVQGYCGEVIENWSKLLLPYTCKKYHSDEDKDLIKRACENIEYLNRLIHTHELADRIGRTRHDIEKIFNINDLNFMTDGWFSHFVEYEGKRYRDNDILKLLEEYETIVKLKYIHEDKYVEYPTHTNLIKFKKLLESGEYKQTE